MSEPRAVGELARIAEEAARAAASVLTGAFSTTVKSGHNDIVTEHDSAAERIIAEMLRERTPEATIRGEEGTDREGDGDLTWHIDPIDGTSNYAAGLPLFCVSIGAERGGVPVAGVIYDPTRDELFATTDAGVVVNGRRVEPSTAASDAEALLLTNIPYEGAWFAERDVTAFVPLLRAFRGVRSLGSSALALAQVAVGRASAACELRTNPWDHAAGAALVRAAGGCFEGWDARHRRTADVAAVTGYVAAGAGFSLDESALSRLLSGASIIDHEGNNV